MNKYDKRSRNLAILYIRLFEGCKQLAKLWKAAILGIAVIGFAILIQRIQGIPYAVWMPLLLQNIFTYLLIGGVTAAFVFVAFWLLKLFGTPWRTRSTENTLAMVFTQSDMRSGCPVLISVDKIKGGSVIRREFYSKGIPLTRWAALQTDLEDALDCHLLEPIQYGGKNGNNRNRIVLFTAPGAKQVERGNLIDDEL